MKKSFLIILTVILAVTACFTGCNSQSLFAKSSLPVGEEVQYTATTDMKFIPSENGLDAQDYAYMWWHGGFLTNDKTLMVQTGNYGMSFDPKSAKITRLGGIAQKLTSVEASQGDDQLIMNLSPLLEMDHCLKAANGTDTKVTSVVPYYVNGEIFRVNPEYATGVRFLDSGSYQQRADVMLMVYEDIARMRARVEFACNPDSIQYTYQAISYVNYEPGELYITMKLDQNYNKHEFIGDNTLVIYDASYNGYIFYAAPESGVVFSFNDGVLTISKQNVIMNSGVWEGFSFNIKPACGITQQTVKQVHAKSQLMINTQMLAPHTKESGDVFYDNVTGAYTLETPDSSMFCSFNAESTMNQYERMLTTLYNPTDQPVKVLLNFYKPYKKQANYADSGPAPCLRDAVTGEPIGLPVMISRNPHKYDVDPEPLYNAMWANFYTYVTVLPHQVLQFEFTMPYAKWGDTFCSSVAHLCLIGWGGNQSWIVSSIGSFGESFCYDPDRIHDLSLGTDGHGLLCLKNSYGNNKKYTWTPGVGGSEYFLYYDNEGKRQNLVNMKVRYEAYAPNISRFTMNSYTRDGKVKAEMTFTLSRTNDVNKVLQSFKYTVLEDISYSRLAFYQAGADLYNDSSFRTNHYGDYSGYIDTISLDVNTSEDPGYIDGYTNIKINGEGFWVSQNDNGTYENGEYYGYSRAAVLRKYHATVNGKEYTTPEVSFYRTKQGDISSMLTEINPPKEANGVIKAGSVIEGTVEYFNIPQVKSMYYGPSSIIASIDASKFNTWNLFYDNYVLGGRINVTAAKGEVVDNHPVIVKCGDTSDGIGARFTVSGGMGYVAITIRGVPDYSGWRLFEVVDGVEVMIDQSVQTNDYWQSTYDSVNNTFDLTFNVEHTGNSREYVLKKIG